MLVADDVAARLPGLGSPRQTAQASSGKVSTAASLSITFAAEKIFDRDLPSTYGNAFASK